MIINMCGINWRATKYLEAAILSKKCKYIQDKCLLVDEVEVEALKSCIKIRLYNENNWLCEAKLQDMKMLPQTTFIAKIGSMQMRLPILGIEKT